MATYLRAAASHSSIGFHCSRIAFKVLERLTGAKPSRDDEVLARSLHLMLPDVRVLKIGGPDGEPFPDLNPALQACLPKPFTLSALLTSARTLLDSKNAPQA